MVKDPAITRSNTRSTRGYVRELEVPRTNNHPNPARGGSQGYPLWQRRHALEVLRIYGSYQITADSIGCHPWSVER